MHIPRNLKAYPSTLLRLLAVSIALLMVFGAQAAEPEENAGFAKIFSDHMVLQQNREIRVWGRAEPQTRVTVKLSDKQLAVSVDSSGRWQAVFPAMPAGGPHSLALSGPAGPIDTISNILVGEVWLCSGQSNMAYRMFQMNDHLRETAAPPDSIRLLTIDRNHGVTPLVDFAKAPEWQVADPDSVLPFSAACFLFAREMQKSMDVPFGLINSSWGGSAIESWISAEGLRGVGGFDRSLDLNTLYGKNPEQALERFVAGWKDWWSQAGGETPGPWDSSYDDKGWTDAPPGLGDWQQWTNAGTEDFTGMVWYRKTFELTPAQAEGGAVLDLGGVDELDVTWVNDEAIGTRFGWGDLRQYGLEPGVLKPGLNVLSVNVYNGWGAGGLNGPPEAISLRLADGARIPLGEGWRYQLAAPEFGSPPKAPWESITGVTGLYNAMIAPLRGIGLSGVMWYQGESNTGRPPSYETLLNAMIADWRKAFGKSLPFIVIQLPNFGELPGAPSDSGWAQLRHDQQRAALADPLTGLVVTLDSADRTDLHPPNKRIVAERAAAVARGLLLGSGKLVDGIEPLRAERRGKQVWVSFGEDGLPLRVAGSAGPAGFELCSETSGCRHVHAWLEDNTVVLQAEGSESATEVRYAWADAPLVNLFGAEGLPVGSFKLKIEAASD